MSLVPRQFVLLFIVLVMAQGCQESGDSLEGDLKQMGLAYVTFQEEMQKSPSGWDELITFAEDHDLSAEAIRRVREAGYTVTWNLATTGAEASDSTVLAQPPGEGRRLMADGGLEE